MEERMTGEEFYALMELLWHCDPWPIVPKTEESIETITGWADKEARARGYSNWKQAYHLIDSAVTVLRDSSTP
jgi:hypothetical protein